MDSYRSHGDTGGAGDYDLPSIAFGDAPVEQPPSPVGQDERRMQVRAYNLWASLLDGRHYPPISALTGKDALGIGRQAQSDLEPYSVLLDFSDGIENPIVASLGAALA